MRRIERGARVHGVAAAATAVLLACLWIVTPSSALAQTRVIELGTLGGNDAESRGFNRDGFVVGWSDIPDAADHAFIWDNGVMTDLGTLGGRESNARDINDSKIAVGRADINFWFQHAFRWSNGTMNDMGTLGGPESSAYSVNNAGQIVGWANTSSGATRAFLWENGTMSDLGTLGGISSWGRAINEPGDIAGYSVINGGVKHAFLYRSGQMTDMGTLGGPQSRAYAINDNAEIAGESDTSAGPSHAAFWSGGNVIDLGTLGGTKSQAWDVNNLGQVIGWSNIATGVKRAFLWENGVMTNLNDLLPFGSDWNLKEARAIDDDGRIVGRGTIAGRTRAFLLIPDPGNSLVLAPPVPGTAGQVNDFNVTGATPSEVSTYVYGVRSGSDPVPGCVGVTLGIGNAIQFGTAVADGNGNATLQIFVPNAGSGKTIMFQVYEKASCRVTNVVIHRFP